MENDGHDTTVDFAGNWSRSFLSPLLNNTKFMNKTLVLLTFDENETYTIKNKVWSVLLGDAVPPSLRGTVDDTFYTHYSCISTIQANWGLYHLGRNDVNANWSNVFAFVANKTGYQNVAVTDAQIPFFNVTTSGYFFKSPGPIPALNVNATGAGGKGILPSLKGANASAIPPPASSGSATATASGSASASGSGTAAASPSGSKSAAVQQFVYSFEAMMGLILAVAAFSIGLVV